jgi:hypothetical protein
MNPNTMTSVGLALALAFAKAAAADLPPPPTRQVHLDFHTSEHIPGIGQKFDKAQFQAALRAGRVNQINIFAKCHHSWTRGATSPTCFTARRCSAVK